MQVTQAKNVFHREICRSLTFAICFNSLCVEVTHNLQFQSYFHTIKVFKNLLHLHRKRLDVPFPVNTRAHVTGFDDVSYQQKESKKVVGWVFPRSFEGPFDFNFSPKFSRIAVLFKQTLHEGLFSKTQRNIGQFSGVLRRNNTELHEGAAWPCRY